MVFSFSFLFFKRSMQIPIKIPTGSIQDKEIEYFTLVIYMVHDYSFFGSTADFVIKKVHLRFLPELAISKRQRRQVEILP